MHRPQPTIMNGLSSQRAKSLLRKWFATIQLISNQLSSWFSVQNTSWSFQTLNETMSCWGKQLISEHPNLPNPLNYITTRSLPGRVLFGLLDLYFPTKPMSLKTIATTSHHTLHQSTLRVLQLDKAIRKKVGSVNDVLPNDFGKFHCLKT